MGWFDKINMIISICKIILPHIGIGLFAIVIVRGIVYRAYNCFDITIIIIISTIIITRVV